MILKIGFTDWVITFIRMSFEIPTSSNDIATGRFHSITWILGSQNLLVDNDFNVVAVIDSDVTFGSLLLSNAVPSPCRGDNQRGSE